MGKIHDPAKTLLAGGLPTASLTRERILPRLGAAEIASWLLLEGRESQEPLDLLTRFCGFLREAGVPLARASITVRLQHPQLIAMTLYWREESGGELFLRDHANVSIEEYGASPIRTILEDGGDAMRFPLERLQAPFAYPILEELKDDAFTDYVVLPLELSGGRRAFSSWASRLPNGFEVAELQVLYDVLPALQMVVETLTQRALIESIVTTYLGADAGHRVLQGQMRRGTVDSIPAILWYTDLRGSTELAEALDGPELIALLNTYFDAVTQPLTQSGGEILKFIGDAVLCIYPLHDGSEEASARAATALKAARDAQEALSTLNARRRQDGVPLLKAGIGLHYGEVMYGNIGTAERLDFTVIGPAVNLVVRLETLSKSLPYDVLVSGAFHEVLTGVKPYLREAEGGHWCQASDNGCVEYRDTGWHRLRGVRDSVRVFALNCGETVEVDEAELEVATG